MPQCASELQRAYHELGYVSVEGVLPAHELDALNGSLDAIVAGGKYLRGAGNREGSIHALSLISEHAKRLEADERILNLVEELVQPGVAVHSSKLVTKLPLANDICHWHQDDAYFGTPGRSRCSVWIPLQDTDTRNGCLWVVPASHRQGLLEHGRKEWGVCRLALNEDAVDLARAVPLPAKAGSLVIFHSQVWHHSRNNETNQIRRAFIVTYQEATAPRSGAQWRILRGA